MGVQANRLTQDIVLDNIRVEGFDVGVVVPPRRSTVIQGGRFANIQNFVIPKGHDTIRSVTITSPMFVPLTPAQLNGRQIYDVTLTTSLAPTDNLDRELDSLFSSDDIRIDIGGGQNFRLYYTDQGANTIPFPTAPVPAITGFPAAYIGKTNQQLSQLYGVWFNGGTLPSGAFTPPKYRGFAVGDSTVIRSDFDVDGDVDGADLLAWQRGLGMQAPNAQKNNGDADGDRDVDAADLAEWRADASLAAADPVVEAAAASPETGVGHGAMIHSVVEMQSLAGAALALGDKPSPEQGGLVAEETPTGVAEQAPLDPRATALLNVTEVNERSRAWRPPVREDFDELDDDIFSGVFEQFDPTLGL
jgi:hypothetical protein